MRLHVGKRSWLIYRTIAKLEEELDPALFIRVHRSAILRRDTIVGLSSDAMGHWAARLSDGSEQRIGRRHIRSEEHTSELQSLMRNSYAVLCFKNKTANRHHTKNY